MEERSRWDSVVKFDIEEKGGMIATLCKYLIVKRALSSFVLFFK